MVVGARYAPAAFFVVNRSTRFPVDPVSRRPGFRSTWFPGVIAPITPGMMCFVYPGTGPAAVAVLYLGSKPLRGTI